MPARRRLGLSVTREMTLDTFRQKTFATALTAARESGASAFRAHAGAEPVLTFPCAFGWLISAFHRAGRCAPRGLRAVTLGRGRGMSMQPARMGMFWIRRLP